MYIRYQHARNGGVLAALAGLVAGGASMMGAEAEPPRGYTVEDPGLRAAKIFVDGRATVPKVKDVIGPDGPKINLYDDDGDGRWDRAKVDRDRDDTWDRTWARENGELVVRDAAGTVTHVYSPLQDTWLLTNEEMLRPTSPPPETAEAPTDSTEWVPLVRRMLESPATDKKRKDALFGDGPKVNLYDDDGDGAWDRAKVDRDRDDTWDEKWSRKGSALERRIEATGQVLTLRDGAWDGEETPAAAEAAPAAPAEPGDDHLRKAALTLTTGRALSKKKKDLFGGRGPKVNLYDDDQDGTWDRAKVDRDRDDTWDEKWSNKGGQLERKHEATGQVEVFTGDGWRAK